MLVPVAARTSTTPRPATIAENNALGANARLGTMGAVHTFHPSQDTIVN
ncbi:MAG: hypothetical protein IPQ07_37000 [Myxococcales bacterium]|nr:hypothetical protein [Myxococcales bacterium]